VKTDQVGALCVRRRNKGGYQVLLITSRDRGRWIIPKGWRAKRLKDHKAAAREAKEEAGVRGKVQEKPIGSYAYPKIVDARERSVRVAVFLLDVRQQRNDWKERRERRRAWFDIGAALKEIEEPALRTLIKGVGAIAA
jgi:8-oxo-dGTP pyrophosphatase MutT (NUDIX family)